MSTLCAVGGCRNSLRSDNRTGVCRDHKRMHGKCRRCQKRINARHDHCFPCRLKERKKGVVMPHPCESPKCQNTTKSPLGYCRTHMRRAKPCTIDGCDNWVSSWSRSGCCYDHRVIGRKLLGDD